MTREEAVKLLKYNSSVIHSTKDEDVDSREVEALDMAIKALEQEPCDDAISRQSAIDALIKWYGYEPGDIGAFENIVEKLPPVTSQPKTGHWIDPDGDNAICDCCNRLNHFYGAYCKHCGAKMQGVKE